jgi:hypothetical protein
VSGLSFVTLAAYDHARLLQSIAAYYAIADEIVVGLDEEGLSWSLQPLKLDGAELEARLKAADPRGILRVVRGPFHAHPRPMDNELEERRFLSRLCREGNWVVQIDADELLLKPLDFRDHLLKQRPGVQVMARWLTVYKALPGKLLLVKGPSDWAPLASLSRDRYRHGRETGEPRSYSPFWLLHNSWGYTEEEVRFKLRNWGHALEVDAAGFLDQWKRMDADNFKACRNLSPVNPPSWPRLELLDLGQQSLEDYALALPAAWSLRTQWALWRFRLGRKARSLKKRWGAPWA